MIIAISDTRYGNYITWKPNGRCIFKEECNNCQLHKELQDSDSCIDYRTLLISLTNQNGLPYTFDTDDYPEAFI